jgi:FAD/FMN-containing dehydrogenase
VEAELVTAEGEVIMASANDQPDLFWALRGGGGNFGVVSAFRFTLHPVGPTVLAGPVFWAAEDTTDVLRFYREFVTTPDELGNVIRVGTILPWPTVNEELHFRPAIAVTSCYAGPVENGERAVRALREFGTPLVDLVGPTSVAPRRPGAARHHRLRRSRRGPQHRHRGHLAPWRVRRARRGRDHVGASVPRSPPTAPRWRRLGQLP